MKTEFSVKFINTKEGWTALIYENGEFKGKKLYRYKTKKEAKEAVTFYYPNTKEVI